MKISIITVCLNGERTIEHTIQSVIGQNDGDCEYIIIDGKSTDKTLDIIHRYEKDIAVVRSEPDGGVYDAMNKGIALATGDIIGIINSDDWYEPGIFREIRKRFRESEAEVVHGWQNCIHMDGKSETLKTDDPEKIRYAINMYHPTVFVKREVYEKYGAFQLKYKIAADYDLLLRLYVNGVKFCGLDKVIANYRAGGLSDQYYLKGAEEVRVISQSYLSYAPLNRRAYVKQMLDRQYRSAYFEEMLRRYPYCLAHILREKFGEGQVDDTVIFGVGNWGQKAYRALRENGVKVSSFADNDKAKQKASIGQLKVLPPDSLKGFRGIVLVLVRNHSREILLQVGDLNNPDLYCISWEEIAGEYILMKKEKRTDVDWEESYAVDKAGERV